MLAAEYGWELLFHLHFDAPDVPALEASYARAGFRVRGRFGYVGREHRRFDPEVSYDELQANGVRLRLVELERGAVNVVLMRSRSAEVRFGHLGFIANGSEREPILRRAADLGLRVRGGTIRWLISTGQHFSLELADPSRHHYDQRAKDELRVESVVVGCADPGGARTVFSELLGPALAAHVTFRPGPRSHAELFSCQLAGTSSVAHVRLPLR